MTTLDIENVFWKIHEKVKNKHDLETAFVHTIGGVTGLMMLGILGWFFWMFASTSFNACIDYESLPDGMSRVGETGSKRIEFVMKLTEKLGYKDNWRKMYTDLELGVFNLKNSKIKQSIIE